MAQKEIALMQVRTGKFRDLPLSLEKGQIGFCTDVGRVFIGLPSKTEPASIVAGRTWENSPNSGKENVEILTEFSPQELVSKVIYKPFKVEVPAGGTASVNAQSTSRVFLEYVGYTVTDTTLLESGSVQLVAQDGSVLISQQNNTNSEDGLPVIEFEDPVFDVPTNRMQINISNSSTEDYTVEFIIRGWDLM